MSPTRPEYDDGMAGKTDEEVAAAAAAGLAAAEAAEAAEQLEFWLGSEITIPTTTESAVLGGKEKDGKKEVLVKYSLCVNGTPYRDYSYAEFFDFREAMLKLPELKAAKVKFPKFPSRTMGKANAKDVEERRTLFAGWLQTAVKLQEVVSTELFATFVVRAVDYTKVNLQIRKKIVEIDQIPEASWKISCQKNGVTIMTTKKEGSSFLVVRSLCKIPIPMHMVWKYYVDKDLWKHWQPDMKLCKTIEVIKPGEPETGIGFEEAMYVQYYAPVVKDRDVAMYATQLQGTINNSADTTKRSLLSCSIQHPDMPKNKAYVRADCPVSRTVFTSSDGGASCEIETVMHMDPKGSLPAGIVNMAVAKATDSVVVMSTVMCKMHVENGGTVFDPADPSTAAPEPVTPPASPAKKSSTVMAM
jgi:hypothetical protein